MSRRLVAACVALLVATAGAAVEIPAPDGWVTDRADLLTPDQERALEALMESYKAGSTNEIALLTLGDLGGRPIESVALEFGRAWGLGEKGRSNGALLVVARKERKVRIEVGRGLEGTLTDSISGRVIRDVIGPEFKRGRYYEGLRGGIEALHAAAGGDYGKLPARGGRSGRSGLSGLVFLFFILLLLLGGGRRGGGLANVLPWLILGSMTSRHRGGRSSGWHIGGSSGGGLSGGGGFGGFGGGGGFSGGGASGGW